MRGSDEEGEWEVVLYHHSRGERESEGREGNGRSEGGHTVAPLEGEREG